MPKSRAAIKQPRLLSCHNPSPAGHQSNANICRLIQVVDGGKSPTHATLSFSAPGKVDGGPPNSSHLAIPLPHGFDSASLEGNASMNPPGVYPPVVKASRWRNVLRSDK